MPSAPRTKRLIDGQVSLNHKHGRSHDLGLLKHQASLPVQDTIDTTNNSFRTLWVK